MVITANTTAFDVDADDDDDDVMAVVVTLVHCSVIDNVKSDAGKFSN